jgi:hypothetical protein
MDSKLIESIRHIIKKGLIGIKVNKGSLINDDGAFYEGLYGGREFRTANAGKKAQAAEINTQYRNVFIPHQGYRIQQRTISAETNKKFDGGGEVIGVFENGDLIRKPKGRPDGFIKGLIDNELHVFFAQFIEQLLDFSFLIIIDYPAIDGYFHNLKYKNIEFSIHNLNAAYRINTGYGIQDIG